MSLNITIINEDQDFAVSLSQILEMDDHVVNHSKTPKPVLDALDAGHAGILVVDYGERKMPAAEMIAAIAEKSPNAKVIVTATPEQAANAQGLAFSNIMGVLTKPIDFDALDELIAGTPAQATVAPTPTEAPQAEATAPEPEIQEPAPMPEPEPVVAEEPAEAPAAPQAPAAPAIKRDPLVVVGHSDAGKRLYKEWQTLIGRTEDLVLSGDKGVGKASFLRALNLTTPIIEVKCAKLDRKTSDKELFGQDEKGLNLSSADESYLDQAMGGTLVLYDIEQLPPSTQEAMQRVIKTRKDMAAAGNAKLFNFRLIATSTFDLRELAAQRKFSPLLLNAIDPIYVDIPPLRDRGVDPVMMFEAAMQLAADELQVTCPDMTPKLASALSAYNWPGNLRELRQSARNYVMEQTGTAGDPLSETGEVISLAANTRRA